MIEGIVEKEVLDTLKGKMANKIVENYREYLMESGQDIGNAGRFKMMKYLYDKIEIEIAAKCDIDNEDLDKLFESKKEEQKEVRK